MPTCTPIHLQDRYSSSTVPAPGRGGVGRRDTQPQPSTASTCERTREVEEEEEMVVQNTHVGGVLPLVNAHLIRAYEYVRVCVNGLGGVLF